MSPLAINLTFLVVMLILSAFFSGSEMAFLASNKLLLEIDRKRQRHPHISKILEGFYNQPSLLITTVLVGNNICMVIYGLIITDTLGVFLSQYVASPSLNLLLQTILSTIVIIVVGEFIPKNIIQGNPSAMLNFLAVPLCFFYYVFYPVTLLLQKTASLVLRLLRVPPQPDEQNAVFGRVDFDNLVSLQAESNHEPDSDVGFEARLMRNALDFTSIKVRDCFVPRTDMVAVDVNADVSDLDKLFIDTGFSKILVYEERFDNITGYVHVSDMFKHKGSIKDMMREVAVVPMTMPANLLLKQFTSQNSSMAVVVDEFGGIAGLITLEDVLEEIFGEINDEHDRSEIIDRRIDDNTFEFSGRMEVEDINEKYGLHLPLTDDYDTVAGLILSETQSIPSKGDKVEFDDFEFEIVKAGSTTINEVRLTIK